MRKILLLLLLFSSLLYSQHALKKISLQLLWLDQFQFAGYYIAKEKGFYRDVGLDVTLKPYSYGLDVNKEVAEGKTSFGIGRADIIRYDSSGKKIALLAAIFQSTPNVLITLESSNIKTIADFAGKRMMQTKDLVNSASINAMLKAKGIDFSSLKVLEHTSNLQDLIDSKVDIYSGYISNEPYTLRKQHIAYKLFSSKAAGFDLYSDILFTSQKYLKESPVDVKNFKEASLKGWVYAFNHIEESVDTILKTHNSQNKSREALLFEARELKKLAYFNTSKLGNIDPVEIRRIYDLYNILGVTTEKLDVKSLLYDSERVYFSDEEKAYLKRKGKIKFCTQPDSLPYSAIENEKIIGIGGGLLEMIHKNSSLEFELVPTKQWSESLKKIVTRECDILPMAAQTTKRSKYIDFTSSYYREPLVLVTHMSENYILEITSVINKKFCAVAGNSFIESLREKYPNIDIDEVANIDEGFSGVEQGKYFAFINVMMSSAYQMQHSSKKHLKINGQFDEPIEVCFAVRNDDKILFSILNKVATHLDTEGLQKILNRWISVNYTKGIDYWYFREIGFFTLLFILGMLSRGYLLKRKNSELKLLQDKLLELNETLETKVADAVYELEIAQEVASIGSWIHDIEHNSLRFSKQTYELFDVDINEKENLYDFFKARIHPEDLEFVIESYTESLKKQEYYLCQHRLLMNDGSIRYVNTRGRTTFDTNGRALITYGTVQDVTQKVKDQEELAKKDAFLLHQSRLAQMGEMLSMIAHQWKQPLSAISSTEITLKTTIELEKYDLSKETQREEFLSFLLERLDKIALYVQSLAKTINDFSDYYKPNKASTLVSIDSIILKSIDLISDSMKASDVEILLNLNADKELKAHENELMQVMLNVLNNAKDQLLSKSIKNPKIFLRSYIENSNVIVEIEDNGGGIDKDILSKIFDPYFSTKLEKNGTGLGLYMCRMILREYHKGNIEAFNVKEGAIFKITINREAS